MLEFLEFLEFQQKPVDLVLEKGGWWPKLRDGLGRNPTGLVHERLPNLAKQNGIRLPLNKFRDAPSKPWLGALVARDQGMNAAHEHSSTAHWANAWHNAGG